VSRHQTKLASMHVLRFGTQSKQSSKQPFSQGMKASIANLIKMRRHKLKSALGYVSKNGCKWGSNPCPHQPINTELLWL